MTVSNPSFEAPTGTTPTLTSSNLETFDLVDGTFLDIAVTDAGDVSGVYRWRVDAADLGGSVLARTAAQVVAAIQGAALEGVTAQTDGTAVVLVGTINASTIQVVGGQPQLVLQFPEDPATGTSEFGAGQGWTVSVVGTVHEWAGFGSSPELPLEDHEVGFGQTAFVVSEAVFEGFETDYGILTVGASLVAATFGTLLQQVDHYESEHDIVAVNDPFETDDALQGGVVGTESFEEDYDITPVTSPTAYESALFNGDVNDIDSNEGVLLVNYIVTINDAVDGNDYRIEINGEPYTYVAGLADSATAIADELATLIAADGAFSAAGLGADVTIWPNVRRPGIVDVINVGGSGALSFISALDSTDPTYANAVVGQDINPTL